MDRTCAKRGGYVSGYVFLSLTREGTPFWSESHRMSLGPSPPEGFGRRSGQKRDDLREAGGSGASAGRAESVTFPITGPMMKVFTKRSVQFG